MKRLLYSLLIMLGIITISISACKKQNLDAEIQDLTSVDESVVAAETISDTFTDLSSLSAENDGLFSVSSNGFQIMNVGEVISTSCVEVNITSTWPKTMTINFGDGCMVENVTRKGKVIAVFTDRLKNAGAKVTVTFENFTVNGHKVEGTKIITNNGQNAAGKLNFTVQVSELKISSADKVFKFSSQNNIEWVEGAGTIVASDDIFSITGSATATNSKGKEISITIVKPLIKKVACKFIVAGSTEIKSGSTAMWAVDYGAGDCDSKAILTVLGESKEITLGK
jgi:hypothetical protein